MARLDSFTDNDLTQLVDMAAESMGMEPGTDYSPRSVYLEERASEFEQAMSESLLEFDPEGKGLEEDGWALDIYNTLSGAGAGIWDGRWDHIYSESEIEALKKHLKKKLSRWADDTGGGKFNEALMDEAEAIGAVEEDDDGEDDA